MQIRPEPQVGGVLGQRQPLQDRNVQVRGRLGALDGVGDGLVPAAADDTGVVTGFARHDSSVTRR